jgi:hypothetical protein
MVALRTTKFHIKIFYVLPTECISVLRIVLRKTAISSLYSINWLAFIIETQYVYYTALNIVHANPSQWQCYGWGS